MARLDVVIDGKAAIGDRAFPNLMIAASLSDKPTAILYENIFQLIGVAGQATSVIYAARGTRTRKEA